MADPARTDVDQLAEHEDALRYYIDLWADAPADHYADAVIALDWLLAALIVERDARQHAEREWKASERARTYVVDVLLKDAKLARQHAERERDELGNAVARERAKPGGTYDQAAYAQLAAERDAALAVLSEVVEAAYALTGLDFANPSNHREAAEEINAGLRMTAAVENARAALAAAGVRTPEEGEP